ncbi:MAG: SGNH/GDSL hydrolase family protein [Anditalea sp.]
MVNRRDFIKTTSLAGISVLGIPEIVNAAIPSEKIASAIRLSSGDKILFQGDSITDAGRNKEKTTFNNPNDLGNGYAFLAAAELLHNHADKNLQIYNKGISGNKVFELAERWKNDCLAIQPEVLSILIGVNDYWHKHNGKYNGTVEVYKKDLMALLDRTKQQLPNLKLVIGEPFAVKGVKAVDDSWYPEFDAYRDAAKEVAKAFDAVFVPFQSIFDKAEKSAPGSYWTTDGVHPTMAGSELMAQAWLKAVK